METPDTGDDTGFRASVAQDSTFIANDVAGKTQDRAFVFVDEVQKCESVFDAVKLVFDRNKTGFIVSGSNPHYLNTVAKKRLQRRSRFQSLLPLSLPEILADLGHIDLNRTQALFINLLFHEKLCEVENLKISLTPPINSIVAKYLKRGGFPLAFNAGDDRSALIEIRQIIERGFESLLHDAENISDLVNVQLAAIHAREFAYEGFFRRSGLKSRDRINAVINELIGHGYVVAKKPIFLTDDRRSYLSVYSYTDPGIVWYLTGIPPEGDAIGHIIEGMVHARLQQILSDQPEKSELGYYKPYEVDINNKTKFKPGEIDFLIRVGKRIVPIEVKSTTSLHGIDTPILDAFVADNKLPFGIVLYGGVPYADVAKKRIYWPYWMV